MDIRLVALDLDDTLLDRSRKVSPRAKAAIKAAVAQGVTVTVATGRMYPSALPYARQLALDVPLITYNGALVRAALSGETLLHRPIAEATAHRLLALFRERGWHVQVYLNDVLFVRVRDANCRAYEAIAGLEAVSVGDELWSLKGAPTKLLTMAEPHRIPEIEAAVRELCGDRVYITASRPTFLEMTDPAATKGAALAFLAGRLGIGREAVMAVGDSMNDLDMIEYAGWGVAMGNAAPPVKAAARAVTAANDADGVAAAIEEYVLKTGVS
jgi:Cof subfamily protein (haloacid dehalogenase superfamily)